LQDRFIITEYNRSIQGFLVGSVERIINTNWENILPPPNGVGRSNYLTAVTEFEDCLIEVLDIEKTLDEISPVTSDVSEDIIDESIKNIVKDKKIPVAEDSSVARRQIERALNMLGLEYEMIKNGRERLNLMKEISKTEPIQNRFSLLISDVEMPEMDGYILTAEVKADPALADLDVILQTSLSGVFNQAMVEKVGADDFIAKFNPDELAAAVQRVIHLDD